MRRISFLVLAAVGLAGCVSQEPMPQVIYDYPASAPVKTLPPPIASRPAPAPSMPLPSGGVPRYWLPSRPDRAWSAIIIHHSATREGNAAIIDKWHREKNGWDGIGYDFVIGNGTNSSDGEIEPTYRWRGQLTGAHAGGTPGNWANEEGIGICLIGDFNYSIPTPKQRASLVQLIRFLQQRYHIPKNRIYGHGNTPGGHVTDCPGDRFPMAWLKSALPN
ncbi:MAG: peptidoglycan recognition family protein [Planctomycetota bacterium]